jgi:hypothetical protein
LESILIACRPKNDEDGTIRLDGFLASHGIRGFKELQALPSSKKTAFTKAKSKCVFESLAEFQDIPTIVCFLNFLEFCRDSNPPRPLNIFNGDDRLFEPLKEKNTSNARLCDRKDNEAH